MQKASPLNSTLAINQSLPALKEQINSTSVAKGETEKVNLEEVVMKNHFKSVQGQKIHLSLK